MSGSTDRYIARFAGIAALALAGLPLAGGVAAAAPFKCPTQSPRLIYAQAAQAPGFDQHFSSAVSTRNVAMLFFETLITRDENNAIIPELASDYSESSDGLTYTFKLRSGIRFHNGQPLTAADAVASIERYRRVGGNRSILDKVTAIAAPDPMTVTITLSQRVPTFLEDFSAFGTPIVILPASERDKEANKIAFIGTGPFKFVEWVPDSHVTLERYADYQPDTRFEKASGFGGYKQVCFDRVSIRIVKEDGARVAGLEAGEYHGIEELPTKAAQRLQGHPRIDVIRQDNFGIPIAVPNLKKPPTDNLLIRKAIQAALDMKAIMEVATDGAYTLQPGFQYPGTPFYTDAGKQFYNQANPELAKKYMAEAGYKGEELIVMTNNDYSYMYNAAMILSAQLRAVGFRTRLEVTDWPTTRTIRANQPDKWSFYFTGWGTGPALGPRAAISDMMFPFNMANLPAEDPVMRKHWDDMVNLPTDAERLAAFARMQEHLYAQAYQFKFGDMHRFQANLKTMKGFVPHRIPRLWNVWLER